MITFIEWCLKKDLASINEDGTITLKESEKKSEKGKLVPYKDDSASGVRDIRRDLSKDYKDYAKSFGDVWPFKICPAPGEGKPVANVAK